MPKIIIFLETVSLFTFGALVRLTIASANKDDQIDQWKTSVIVSTNRRSDAQIWRYFLPFAVWLSEVLRTVRILLVIVKKLRCDMTVEIYIKYAYFVRHLKKCVTICFIFLKSVHVLHERYNTLWEVGDGTEN